MLTLATSAGAMPLFDDTAPLDAELIGPVNALMRRPGNREEVSFVLRAGGVELDVRARLRGSSRRRICSFKPLRLNFEYAATAGTVFDGQDGIKLVVPCSKSERAEKDLLEEYAAYRIFNLVTPASYRVRLLQILYTDPGDDSWRLYGFAIEPDAQLAARLGGRVAEVPEITPDSLDAEQAALAYVFHYLIGNTDWSLKRTNDASACCHNGTLIETATGLMYVPYDFDMAGLVDAPYAEPARELRIDSVTRRRYLGLCTSRDVLRDALARIRSRREAIGAVIQALPVLSDLDKRRRNAYLELFFRSLEKEEKVLDHFEARCIE